MIIPIRGDHFAVWIVLANHLGIFHDYEYQSRCVWREGLSFEERCVQQETPGGIIKD